MSIRIRSAGLGYINYVLRTRIRKGVAFLILLFSVAVMASAANHIIKNAKAYSGRPSVYLNKIGLTAQHPLGAAIDDRSIDIRINDTFRLPKSIDGQYISKFKVGPNQELYFRLYSLEERKSTLVKIDKDNNETVYNEIAVPSLSSMGGMTDFDIDEKGGIYIAGGGGIITVVNDGRLTSVIQTGDFRPISLIVDKEHRIWAVGVLLNASMMKYIMRPSTQDDQIRVYSISGELLKIAAGGISPFDIGLGRIVKNKEEVSFISHHDQTALYKFDRNMQLLQAKRFPFAQYTSYKQRDAIDTPDEQPACGITSIQTDQGPLVKGIVDINKIKMWYGNMRSDREGVYGNGFVGITDEQDNPLTPCIMLPVRFRAILGADSRGHIYVLDRDSGNLVLHKIEIIPTWLK